MAETKELSRFDIHTTRGFLPPEDPLLTLPGEFEVLEALGRDLPKLLMTDSLHKRVKDLPKLDLSLLKSVAEKERAMLIFSFVGHAYVWGNVRGKAPDSIPASLAVPWHEVSKSLGRPPVLSYESYALSNWRRLDASKPIVAGNVALLQNFFGGADEEWFVIIHVDIEAKAAPALVAIGEAQSGVELSDVTKVSKALHSISVSLEAMYKSLCRMPEYCDPYIYYNRVRPYIHGWKNHPQLPNGLKYEGVTEYGGKPKELRGETGAQSSIIPALDALLGIGHKEDFLAVYLREMREYMPPKHSAFIGAVESGPSVRTFVEANKGNSELKDNYNSSVDWITKFRSKHLEYAAQYILDQHQKSADNPNAVGTGGTPFMSYLAKHRDETADRMIR